MPLELRAMATATKYRALRAVQFGPGDVLALEEAQAGARAGLLEHTAGGLYTARAAVQFKAGELLGLVADVPKRLADALQPVEQPAAAPARAARATKAQGAE